MSKKIYSDDEYIKINHDKSENPYLKIEHDNVDGLESKDVKNYINEDKNFINNYEFNRKVFGSSINRYFCVFRVGKKIKSMNQIMQFQKHNLRDMEVPNADAERSRYNRILIGDKNISEDVQRYIYGIKLRSNANIGMDLVLTANHAFFDELQPSEKEEWIQHNIKFLKDNFGDNCVSAILHCDETALHLHCLIIPRFYNEKKKRYELSSNKYFDGIEKMRSWQDKYANHMNSKFSNLMRGIRGSPI